MKVRTVKDMNGKEVKLFTPETEKDVETLRQMARAGDLDDRESPNDMPAKQ